MYLYSIRVPRRRVCARPPQLRHYNDITAVCAAAHREKRKVQKDFHSFHFATIAHTRIHTYIHIINIHILIRF